MITHVLHFLAGYLTISIIFSMIFLTFAWLNRCKRFQPGEFGMCDRCGCKREDH